MITYKYKLYSTKKTSHIDCLLREACFVWNHALELQRRYYRMFGGYIGVNKMQRHFAKRIPRHLLHSDTAQEILQRQDIAYTRFFKHLSKRPPKFKKDKDFSSIVFKRMGGYLLKGNVLTINTIGKSFKFSLSRPYDGTIKRTIIKRNRLGEYYIYIVLEKDINTLRKTHNGASVGIDFGLKVYMTLSDGTTVDNPQFLKKELHQLRRKSHDFNVRNGNSKNKERKRLELVRLYKKITSRRNEFQWDLAHELCRKYDQIFIEDLNLEGMCKCWGRKMQDLAHNEFVQKLEYVATKYGVVVHKIERFYPSSKLCTCGYINSELRLKDRIWACPQCGEIHERDLNAANNILRRGIYELESVRKTYKPIKVNTLTRYNPTIQSL